jgi:hypothetical protein
MLRKVLNLSILLSAVVSSNALAIKQMWADDQTAQQARDEQIYGSQLMTNQELGEYRKRVHAAANEEEREKIRSEHHKLMQERAQKQGIDLPDEPADMGHHGEHMGQDHQRE